MPSYAKYVTGASAPASTTLRPARAARAGSGKYGSRSMSGRPPPRSARAGKVSPKQAAPVAAAIRAAAFWPRADSARAPSSSTAGTPVRNRSATRASRAASNAGTAGAACARGCDAVSFTAADCRSTGSTSVATPEAAAVAAAIAAAVSRARSSACATLRYQTDTGRASDSMSEVSGASYFRCARA